MCLYYTNLTLRLFHFCTVTNQYCLFLSMSTLNIFNCIYSVQLTACLTPQIHSLAWLWLCEACCCQTNLFLFFQSVASNGSFQQFLQLQNSAERSHAEVDHRQQQQREGEASTQTLATIFLFLSERERERDHMTELDDKCFQAALLQLSSAN